MWFCHRLDPILCNDFSCRSESTEKPILAVTDPVSLSGHNFWVSFFLRKWNFRDRTVRYGTVLYCTVLLPSSRPPHFSLK
jgi:hypothetical protein